MGSLVGPPPFLVLLLTILLTGRPVFLNMFRGVFYRRRWGRMIVTSFTFVVVMLGRRGRGAIVVVVVMMVVGLRLGRGVESLVQSRRHIGVKNLVGGGRVGVAAPGLMRLSVHAMRSGG